MKSNLTKQIDGDVDFDIVRLEGEYAVEDSKNVGIKIEGVTARLNDFKWDPESTEETPYLICDYSIVEGVPEDEEVWKSKLIKVVATIIDAHNGVNS